LTLESCGLIWAWIGSRAEFWSPQDGDPARVRVKRRALVTHGNASARSRTCCWPTVRPAGASATASRCDASTWSANRTCAAPGRPSRRGLSARPAPPASKFRCAGSSPPRRSRTASCKPACATSTSRGSSAASSPTRSISHAACGP
jgi:hypothetical protein